VSRVSIIAYSMIQVRLQVNHQLPPTTVTLRHSIYQARVASLWPLAKIEGPETLFYAWNRRDMGMKGVGCFNHNLSMVQVRLRENLLLPLRCETNNTGWSGILMTTSHSCRCQKPLYMYEVDLLWVWMVWGASIINLQYGTSEKWETKWFSYYLLPLSYCRY
jgi:hypothetical protein